MNPMIDIAMLKHHRVDYARTTDKDGASAKPANLRTVVIVVVAMMAATFITGVTGQA